MSRRASSNSPYPLPREVGTAYLIHFEERYKHAGHYSGFSTNLPGELARHAAGTGARLMKVIRDAGIGWHVSRTWEGVTREQENRIKESSGAKRCPDCGFKPREAKKEAAPKIPKPREAAEQKSDPYAVRDITPVFPRTAADIRECDELTSELIQGWRAEQEEEREAG